MTSSMSYVTRETCNKCGSRLVCDDEFKVLFCVARGCRAKSHPLLADPWLEPEEFFASPRLRTHTGHKAWLKFTGNVLRDPGR